MNKKIELLAPGGNLEKLKIAVDFGADAVYVGGSKLNLRAFSDNFNNEELIEGVKYAHENNAKVYLTINAFPHEESLNGIEEYILEVEKSGIDGIIAADPGIIMTIKQVSPNMHIHLSTQANNVNSKSAIFWYNFGVKRVVLARELSLDEIKKIREEIPEDLELEAFVHGSMCMAYSGRCLISNYMTGRDANGGACSQACRYKYNLVEEKREGEYFPVIEDENGTYIMNSKDLCMINHIDKVIESGITSLKIEGRMKSAYYVAMTVKNYREAIDNYLLNKENYTVNPELLENLKKISHRDYYTGFYFGTKGEQIYESSSYIRTHDIVGIVEEYDKERKVATIKQKNRIFENDSVEILRPKTNGFLISLKNMHLTNGEKIEVANRAEMLFEIDCEIELKRNDMLIKKKDN